MAKSIEEKQLAQNEASRRWRAAHPEKAKQVERDAYHRRQDRLGAKKKRIFANDEDRKEERRRYCREWARRWALAHPDELRKRSKENYWKDPKKNRARAKQRYLEVKATSQDRYQQNRLQSVYGITLEQYNAMGGCAICGATKNKSGYRLHVDHDHATGKVRGKLCEGCNSGLGNFRDDTVRLQNAIEYLLKHKAGE